MSRSNLPVEVPAELVEAVAVAMCEYDSQLDTKWAEANSYPREYWIELARVGLAAVVLSFRSHREGGVQ